jgi:O-antigen ligase
MRLATLNGPLYREMGRPTAIAAAVLAASAALGASVGVVGPQAAAGAVGAAVAIALLRSSGVAFALYLLVPPFLKGFLQPLVPVDLTVALGLACILHVAYGIVVRPVPVRRGALALWFALLAMITLGSLYAPDQGLALSRVQGWVGLVLLPLLIAFWVANDHREVERFIWTCLVVGLVVTLSAVLSFSPSQRLELGFISTINMGRAALMVPLIVFFYVIKAGPTWMRGPLLLIAPLTFLVTLAAGARGPLLMFLALAAALSAWHVARGRQIARGTLAGAAAAVLVLGIVAAVTPLPSMSIGRFAELTAVAGGDTTEEGSLIARLAAADLATSLFEDHPALGAGTGAFAYHSQRTPLISDIETPHNILLEIAADWGVMGLVLFAMLVLAAIRRRPPAPVWTAVWALFLFFLANAMLGSFFEGRAFWGLALLLLAAPVAALPVRPVTEPSESPAPHVEKAALDGEGSQLQPQGHRRGSLPTLPWATPGERVPGDRPG